MFIQHLIDFVRSLHLTSYLQHFVYPQCKFLDGNQYRFLLVTLNGLLGPLQALTSELVTKEHYALGMSDIGTAWGTGLVIGPAVGGFLAQEHIVSWYNTCPKLRENDLDIHQLFHTTLLQNWESTMPNGKEPRGVDVSSYNDIELIDVKIKDLKKQPRFMISEVKKPYCNLLMYELFLGLMIKV